MRQSERRALRRELHDGIGPALAGIGFGLAAADNLVGTDPAAARALVTRLSGDLRERLDDVRALARAMREGATHFDLGADLQALARDFSAAGPTITVDAADAARVPVGLRRTLYLIAAEALHNAVRHADAESIRVSVSVPAEVELSIVDDGRGGVSQSASGVGLATMRERAAEAGAWFDLTSPAGRGTAVRVRVPAAAHPTDTLAARPQELPA
jgi:signal transduction histidine kinase